MCRVPGRIKEVGYRNRLSFVRTRISRTVSVTALLERVQTFISGPRKSRTLLPKTFTETQV